MDGLINFTDMTLLNEHIHHKDIKLFCTRVNKLPVSPASICIYPEHIEAVQSCLVEHKVPTTTVINFPHGLYEWPQVEEEILHAISLNASELDIVIPYGKWQSTHNETAIINFAKHCRDAAGEKLTIKYIIEAGALQDRESIKDVSYLLCEYGADFIKTSTGKTVPGATMKAANAIIEAIRSYYQTSNRKVGIKVAGGIRTLERANAYKDLVGLELGKDWLKPEYFRIGCSQILA